jgi:ABC-type transporter Mla MlaB component
LAAAKPFRAGAEVTVDLSAVGKTDSGTLALLVNWQRQAARQKTAIIFSGLPQSLRALMDLYDLDSVLQTH